eukprot:6206259-Pleurochrysis_carterae.AAC.1
MATAQRSHSCRCRAIRGLKEWERVLASPHAKIWAMFGPGEWVTRRSGQESCFGSNAAAGKFFEDAFNGVDCH